MSIDQGGLHGLNGESVDRSELAQMIRNDPPFGPRDPADALPVTPTDSVYLATTRMIHTVTLTVDNGNDRIPMAWAQRVGPSGVAEELFARSPDGPDESAAARDLLAGYVTAWGSGQPWATAALYAPRAALVDSLLGISTTGRTEIAALATQPAMRGGLPRASLLDLPPGGDPDYYAGAPAAYSNGAFGDASTNALVLLLDVLGDCPGQVGVQLWLDRARRIVREERFHRIDTLRRCLPAGQLPHGWWDSLQPPAGPTVHLAETVPVSDTAIAIWNTTGRPDGRLEGLLRWAVQRFTDAGLAATLPSSVTFLTDIADPWSAYGFETGSNAPDIGVPLPQLQPCAGSCTLAPAAKQAMLHELAHLWLTPGPYSGIPVWSPAWRTGRQFAVGHGLAWVDESGRWSKQAGELAAETLAWGLMDEPAAPDARMGITSCTELTADFELLTRTTPDQRACAQAAGSPAGSRQTLTLTTPDPRACADLASVAAQAPSATPGGAP
ncbi:MAG TPA: hypothetical protein VF143_00760 [Candidatus Nanopelagicales bacterium]